jgi:hypothetical protein
MKWKNLLKNKIFYIIFLFIGLFGGVLTMKIKESTISNEAVEVYHFYHPPFGITCSKVENYIKEIIENNFKNVSFKSVNTNTTTCEQFIKNCPYQEKEVVIFNRNKNKFLASSMRSLIKQGKTKEEVEKTFIAELKSIL